MAWMATYRVKYRKDGRVESMTFQAPANETLARAAAAGRLRRIGVPSSDIFSVQELRQRR